MSQIKEQNIEDLHKAKGVERSILISRHQEWMRQQREQDMKEHRIISKKISRIKKKNKEEKEDGKRNRTALDQ